MDPYEVANHHGNLSELLRAAEQTEADRPRLIALSGSVRDEGGGALTTENLMVRAHIWRTRMLKKARALAGRHDSKAQMSASRMAASMDARSSFSGTLRTILLATCSASHAAKPRNGAHAQW